jgi:hypothetical protein
MKIEKTRSRLFFIGLLSLMLAFALTNVAQGMEWADRRVTLNGMLKNWTGYRFGFYGEERGEGLSMFRNVLQLEAEAKVTEDASVYAIWRGVRETAYHLEDDAVDAGNFDEDVLNEEKFREYYLAWQATDRVWLKLGKQQVVWGDLGGLGLRVMDIINPLDLRWHYAVEDYESMRKPLTMLNTIVSIPEANANIQFVWMPAIDDPWERANSLYTNPGHRWGVNQVPAGSLFGDPAYLTPDGSWYNGGKVPGVWEPDTFVPGVPEDDEADPPGMRRRLSDSTLAIRWQQIIGGLTYSLMECYTHNHNPTVWWEGSPLLGAPVNMKHFRQNILGFSFNWYNQLTSSVFRGEIGHFHHVPYTADKRLMIGGWSGVPNPDFYHLEKKDTIKFGFGWDRNTTFNWLNPARSVLTNFQVIGTYILDHDDDLVVPGYNTEVKELDLMFTLYINWGWSNDRVQINLYPAYNFDREWGMLQAWIDYKPQWLAGGNLTITPKVNLFYGDDAYTGDFAMVRGCSEALLELKYEF